MGQNGFETAKHIQLNDNNARTPISFLTADRESEGLEGAGYAIGAMDFLHKPVGP